MIPELTQPFEIPTIYHNRRKALPSFAHRLGVWALALVWLASVFAGMARADTPRAGDTPQASVKGLLETIQKIREVKGLSAEEARTNRALMDRAAAYLDLLRVSEQTLGKHWKTRSPGEQKQFIELLGELFRYVAFPNSAKFFRDLQIEYQGNSRDGASATVPVVVKHPDEGRIAIDFVMHQDGGAWRVEDVIMDGVSMRTNLRNQFYQILKKEDYPGLVQRMQDRLDKARQGD